MSIHLIVSKDRLPLWRDHFHKLLPTHKIHQPGDSLEDVDYAFVWLPPPGELAQFPNLKVVFSMGAGVDHIFNDPRLPNVPIVRVVDDNLTMRMSEWIVLHVLLHHRQFDKYAAAQSARIWDELQQPSADEVRVGIMGMGVMGCDAALRLRDLKFQVAGWSNSRKAIDGIESFAGTAEREAFLMRTDILVNLLPLTPATREIIDTLLINCLAQDGPLAGPVVINAGRGGSQNEEDILSALQEGRLSGASLDVFVGEPLPKDSPLWSQPGLYVSPHVAASSNPASICTYVADQIARFERGEALTNIVDPDQKY